jgi:CAAX prenyl protease-like protein
LLRANAGLHKLLPQRKTAFECKRRTVFALQHVHLQQQSVCVSTLKRLNRDFRRIDSMPHRSALMPNTGAPTSKMRRHDASWPRVAPFALYIALMAIGQSSIPYLNPLMLYGVQLALTASLLACLWPAYAELHRPQRVRAADALLCIAVGVFVYIAWLLLDAPWMQLGNGRGVAATLGGAHAQWPALALRAVGAVLIVPVMEELFWRSFLLRWLESSRFSAIAPQQISMRAVLVSALLFGAEHHLWLAGIVAGFAYALLYRRTGSLWAVIAAHALTNGLLENWLGRMFWLNS